MPDQSPGVEDLYFCLASDYFIHLHPGGGIVESHDALPRQKDQKEISLNPTAVAIVTSCDGLTPVREILVQQAAVSGRDRRSILDAVSNFLVEGCQAGYLEAHASPRERRPKVTGSSEYYTPRHMMIELTDGCNMACRHCYRESSPSNHQHLPGEVLVNMLQELKAQGVRSVELTGGEPTIHPDFYDILKFCLDNFNICALLSNGYAISLRAMDLMGAHRHKVTVQIDLDGPRAEVHDWLRGAGTFERSLSTIKGLTKRGVPCCLAMNLHAKNVGLIQEVVELARSLGATNFSLSTILPIGRGADMELLSPKDFKKCIRVTKELQEKYPGFFFLRSESQVKLFLDPHHNCGTGWKVMVLGPSGRLRHCTILPESEFCFGDLTRQNYQEILRTSGEVLSALNQATTPSPESCGQCSYATFCTGCLVRPVFARRKNQGRCAWAEQTGLLSLMDIH